MYVHNDNNNIVQDIELIKLTVPKGLSDLEKIRFIYIKLGQLFSYDYYVTEEDAPLFRKVDYSNIGRYQTCYQISEILGYLIKEIIPTSEVEVIKRDSNLRGNSYADHVATSVHFLDSKTEIEYNLILDLTLDLYRIQSDMKTKQFGYTTDRYSTYDIISDRECEKMDKKLGFVGISSYYDDVINSVKEYLECMDMTLNEKIKFIKENLNRKFNGIHEAKMFLNDIFRTVLPDADFKEYNLVPPIIDNSFDLITLFVFNDHNNINYYYILSDKMGLFITDYEVINRMLNRGYKTKSLSLDDRLDKEYDNDSLIDGGYTK